MIGYRGISIGIGIGLCMDIGGNGWTINEGSDIADASVVLQCNSRAIKSNNLGDVAAVAS